MPQTLRDRTTTQDSRLDRIVEFDERSRDFPIAAVVPEDVEEKLWRCILKLDQGEEGACVEFGIAHDLSSKPVTIPAALVRKIIGGHHIYWLAQLRGLPLGLLDRRRDARYLA
jgi:hypothetical protein